LGSFMMPMIGTPTAGTDPVLAVKSAARPCRLGRRSPARAARLDYGLARVFDAGYWSTCRQEGHRATATPTPMETTTSKVSVSPMRKRRID